MTAISSLRRLAPEHRSLVALALLAPAPTIGISASLFWWPGPIGQTVFSAAKLWLVAFPAFWYLVIERGSPSWSPARRGGLFAAVGIGLTMAGAIFAAYLLLGAGRIDPSAVREEVVDMGLDSGLVYIGAALYWIFVNSVVEEYVYRWFMLDHCERLLRTGWAVVAAAALFTVHHVVALASYLDPLLTALASTGVFVAGLVWAWMYGRYRSVWPPWIAHAFADVAIFVCGWWILFG